MLFYDRSCNYASGTYSKSRVERLSTDEAQLSTTKSDGMWGQLLPPRGESSRLWAARLPHLGQAPPLGTLATSEEINRLGHPAVLASDRHPSHLCHLGHGRRCLTPDESQR